MRIRRFLSKLLVRLIQMLDYIWPKDSRVLLFGSHAAKMAGGNSKALYDYIQNQESKLFKCYYIVNQHSSKDEYVHPRSLRFINLFLRAKTLLVTHGLSDMGRLRPSSRKYVIYLWHGQGPKADGYASKAFNTKMLKKLDKTMENATAFLTCSRLDSYSRAYALALKPKQILPLGYPRCDYLLNPNTWFDIIPSLYSNLPEYDKVVLYAITWRKEGNALFFPFDDFTWEDLDDWCRNQKILLLIRPHINVQKDTESEIPESLYIRALTFEMLNDIMYILPKVDLLITDYSSIQTDFFLLNRPIIYIPYDLDEFRKTEGFYYPEYDFWCPGEKVHTFADFKRAVEHGLVGDDTFADQRFLVNRLVNEYQTQGATERVYRYLVKLLKI